MTTQQMIKQLEFEITQIEEFRGCILSDGTAVIYPNKSVAMKAILGRRNRIKALQLQEKKKNG